MTPAADTAWIVQGQPVSAAKLKADLDDLQARLAALEGTARYPGEILELATDVVPPGTLECNGQEVSRATYARLFATIGTRFGQGDGVSTFNLPPGGVFYRSWDHGAGNDPDANSRSGFNGGATGDNVGSLEADGVGTHQHSLGPGPQVYNGGQNQQYDLAPSANLMGHVYYTDATGPGIGSETRPKNVSILRVIVY